MAMSTRSIRSAVLNASLLVLAAMLPPLAGAAEELPQLRPGMWEIKRTVALAGSGSKGQLIENRQCTDPSANMKKQNELVAKTGCKTSPLSKDGDAYSFTLECEIQGVKMQSKSTITIASDSEYRIDIESQGGGRGSKEVLMARRVGDCAPN